MKRITFKYVQRYRDRHGKERFYLRRPGSPRRALPHPDDPLFAVAYAEALTLTKKMKCEDRPKTFKTLMKDWQSGQRFAQLRESTQIAYRRILVRLEREDFADHMVMDFEPRHIRRFVARVAETPAAANIRLKLFRALFDHAVNIGWRDDNPATLVKRLKEKQEGAASWTEAQISAYEERWASGSVQRLAFALLLYTGQRRSDVVRMGAQDIDDGLLNIKQQKTGACLTIPIHGNLLKELEIAKGRHPFLKTASGRPFTANGFYMRFKGWREEAGLPAGLSPHGLRKAAARRLAEAGCSTHEIASITGHASLAEVQRYTRAVNQKELAKKALSRIRNV